MTREVLPAYKAFADFIATEYAPHGRAALSIASLPGGKARYLNDIRSRTTVSSLTPAQIHEIGLKEIARIQADMLDDRAQARLCGSGDPSANPSRANPKYKPTSAAEIVDAFRKYIAQMQPKLPDLFTVIPRSPVTVEPMPDSRRRMPRTIKRALPTANAQAGSSRPCPTSPTVRSSMMRPLPNHEGIPGHHMSSRWRNGSSACPSSVSIASNT